MEPKAKLIAHWTDPRGPGVRYRLVLVGAVNAQPAFVLERAERDAMGGDRWTKVQIVGKEGMDVLCLGVMAQAARAEAAEHAASTAGGDRLG